MVEECADRLSDEDVDALCELVATHLGASEGMEVSSIFYVYGVCFGRAVCAWEMEQEVDGSAFQKV